jgi:hypothetical protein
MNEADSSPTGPPTAPRSNWERTIFRMFILLLLCGSGLYVFKSCRDLPGRAVDKTVDKTVQIMTNVTRSLAEMASAFHQGTLTFNLTSTGTALENTKYFQFKKIRQTEIFRHTDQATTGFGYIPLPEVIVEARAPVEYTYFLDLDAPWQFVVQGQQVQVFTPRIRFNKPAVDVSRLQYEVRQGSLFRDSSSAMDQLKNSISSLAYLKARENLDLVRQTGRQPVAEFVQQWLIRSFADGSNYTVRVYFPGEPAPPGVTIERAAEDKTGSDDK